MNTITLTDSQKWLMLAVLIGTTLLLYLLGPILTPFVIGALFAYLGDPLADQLEDKGLSRTISVVIVFSVMSIFVGLLLFVLVPIIGQQIASFIKSVPQYIDSITNTGIPWVEEKIGVDLSGFELESIPEMLSGHLGEAGGVVKNLFGYVGKSSGVLFGVLANLFLIPVVTFYMLRDWDKFIEGIHSLLPRQIEPEVTRLASESNLMLSAFLRGQVLVMVSLATIYSIGLWLVGVKFALLIGLIAGIVSFVPYMGLIVGIAIAGIAVLLQFDAPLLPLALVAAVFGVGQVIEGALLTPLLVGDRIGMHPVAVMFSVLAGGQLFGFFGILVALPVAAVLAVIVRDIHKRYMRSHLYDTDRTMIATVHADEVGSESVAEVEEAVVDSSESVKSEVGDATKVSDAKDSDQNPGDSETRA